MAEQTPTPPAAQPPAPPKAASSAATMPPLVKPETNKIEIHEFAGTPGGMFAVYGRNMTEGGQLTINGLVPTVHVRRESVIKGKLFGLSLEAGPVTVKLGDATYKGTL